MTFAGLQSFFEEADGGDRSLIVFNRTQPDPILDLFDDAFGRQSVTVTDEQLPDTDDDVVALVENGDVVTMSPLSEVMNAFLLVNSDLYRSGTSGIDKYEAPTVLTGLHDVRFSLRGFPASNKEKLLLILISRHIERLALDSDTGTLRSSFQELSRLEDERGTRTVYERLSESNVDVHVYGVADWLPEGVLNVTTHFGMTNAYRRSWFVVFNADDPSTASAALLALETDRNEWDGMWTYRRSLVERLDTYIRENL